MIMSVIQHPTVLINLTENLTVEMLGNVVGAPSVRYINLPMDRFEAAIAQMKAGELFGLVQMLVKFQTAKR